MAGSVKLDTTVLDKLSANLEPKAEQIVSSFAFQVEAGAKTRAPVDTGYLKSSIQAERKSRFRWLVNVFAEYGIFVEYGTYKMRAQPFLTPAVESLRQKWEAAWRALLK